MVNLREWREDIEVPFRINIVPLSRDHRPKSLAYYNLQSISRLGQSYEILFGSLCSLIQKSDRDIWLGILASPSAVTYLDTVRVLSGHSERKQPHGLTCMISAF